MEKNNAIVAIVRQSGIAEEKANLMLTSINTYVNQINQWQSQNDEIQVNSIEQKEEMKKADTLRKSIKKDRKDGERFFKAQRTEVQALMADYKAEDTLWLRITQKFEELCKNIESDLDLKATYAERIEAERKQKLLLERTQILSEYSNNPAQYSLEHLTDEAFYELFNGLKLQHQVRIETERRAEEERIELQRKQDKERAEIEAENKRLREEAEQLKREAFEKEQAEKAELQRIADKKRAEEEAEEEAKIKELQAPDKEKLQAFMNLILDNSKSEINIVSGKANQIKTAFENEIQNIYSKYIKLTDLL